MDPSVISTVPPRIEHIEVRYADWKTGKFDRVGVSIVTCLERELQMRGVTAQYWGRVVYDTLICTYLTRPDFWHHIDVSSIEIWNMEQTVRRLLRNKNKDDPSINPARFFTNKDCYNGLVKAVKNRGAKFDRRFSYIYKDWFVRYHAYVQQPAFAVISQVTIPTEECMWLVTTQLYPRIFYEELDTGRRWRKGGIKIEQLIFVEGQWCREMKKTEEAQTLEIAWYEVPMPNDPEPESPETEENPEQIEEKSEQSEEK